MNPPHLRILFAVLALSLPGCSSVHTLMPPPVAFSEGMVPGMEDVDLFGADRFLPVHFATDRAPDADAACGYGNARGEVLRLGVATLELGESSWPFADVVRRSVAGEKVRVACVQAEEHGRLWTTIPTRAADFPAARDSTSRDDAIRAGALRFARSVDEQLERSRLRDVYVFVAGYNTTFEATVLLIGQFAHFLGRDSVYLAYSWPARQSALGYVGDKESGRNSARNLRELLLLLARETSADRIHLIGYSAGATVASQALLQLRLMHRELDRDALARELRLGRLLLPAADVDLDFVRSLGLDGIGDLFDGISIYASSSDLAVWASGWLFFRYPRLGSGNVGLTGEEAAELRAERLAIIDPDEAQRQAGWSDFAGHSYWYRNGWVSSDVMLVLRHGLAPGERGLVKAEDGIRWEFPEDYPERLRRVIERLTAEGDVPSGR